MKQIKKMSHKDLLKEYASLCRWEGDDFCLVQMEPKDYRRLQKIEEEILDRMVMGDQPYYA